MQHWTWHNLILHSLTVMMSRGVALSGRNSGPSFFSFDETSTLLITRRVKPNKTSGPSFRLVYGTSFYRWTTTVVPWNPDTQKENVANCACSWRGKYGAAVCTQAKPHLEVTTVCRNLQAFGNSNSSQWVIWVGTSPGPLLFLLTLAFLSPLSNFSYRCLTNTEP